MVYDVIIAGAGPVGLFLACEPRLAKLSVLVLEQSEDPHSSLKRLPFGRRGLWGEQRVRARWLVGCDGGRSTVRKQGGFEFVGTEPEFTGYSVQVEIADPEKLRPGRHYTPTGMYNQGQPGVIAMADFDGGAFHRTQPVTRERVSLRYELGGEHPLVGRSCPDFELEDGTRLGTLLQDGTGLLLDFGRQASLQALEGLWGDQVRYVASHAKDRLGTSRGEMVREPRTSRHPSLTRSRRASELTDDTDRSAALCLLMTRAEVRLAPELLEGLADPVNISLRKNRRM